MATTVTYNMEAFLESCVQRYVELAGGDVQLKYVATPFLTEDTKECRAGAPARKGVVIECPWCLHMVPPTTHDSLAALDRTRGRNFASSALLELALCVFHCAPCIDCLCEFCFSEPPVGRHV